VTVPVFLMSADSGDKTFTGSVPKLYQTHLVPLIFEPYAPELLGRIAATAPRRVLEVGAGTGVVTRALAAGCPATTSIVATDLNQAMLDHAASIGTARPVEWRQADVMQLPFGDDAFDAVVCQFAVMFFPDKAKAFSEIRRVLRPGGVFAFNVWDRLDENDFARAVSDAVARVFPAHPPRFLPRTPYGYYDAAVIAHDLRAGGFTSRAAVEVLPKRSRAESAAAPAIGFVEGTPLRNEIEAIAPTRLHEATDAATAAVAGEFGRGPVEAHMQALAITVEA
jgi:SAM-dependent methyltransferase